MPKYAEVNADGIIVDTFENTGEYKVPTEGGFFIQSTAFAKDSRYEPVAGNYPLAFAFLGTPPVKVVPTKKASTSESA